jgi:hypothetical protein
VEDRSFYFEILIVILFFIKLAYNLDQKKKRHPRTHKKMEVLACASGCFCGWFSGLLCLVGVDERYAPWNRNQPQQQYRAEATERQFRRVASLNPRRQQLYVSDEGEDYFATESESDTDSVQMMTPQRTTAPRPVVANATFYRT